MFFRPVSLWHPVYLCGYLQTTSCDALYWTEMSVVRIIAASVISNCVTRPSNNPQLLPCPLSGRSSGHKHILFLSTISTVTELLLPEKLVDLESIAKLKLAKKLSVFLTEFKRRFVLTETFTFNWHLAPFVLTATEANITAGLSPMSVQSCWQLTILLWLRYFVTKSWKFASLFPTCHTSHYLSKSPPC